MLALTLPINQTRPGKQTNSVSNSAEIEQGIKRGLQITIGEAATSDANPRSRPRNSVEVRERAEDKSKKSGNSQEYEL